MTTQRSLTSTLAAHILQTIEVAGGWIGFDEYMALALYTPGQGYYANDLRKFGTMPAGVKGGGSDFVTAPEMTPLFGQTLAVQVAQALEVTQTREVWEFGAGSGALALQLLDALDALGVDVQSYTIVDLSGTLRERQRQTLAAHAARVRWVSALPATLTGVLIGNEVLDAMPVKLLVRNDGAWHERGVACAAEPACGTSPFVWQDQPTSLRPPVEIPAGYDYLTEVHPQAEAFIRTLAGTLARGAAFFIDYGFPEAEYYHAQRHMGTVMCHRGHLADPDPLVEVGLKDITAHVNFTGLALAAQDAAPDVGTLGYTTQAHFLFNAGLLSKLEHATLAERTMALKLISEHEMGELFKVIGFYKGEPWQALGFAQGDRTPTL